MRQFSVLPRGERGRSFRYLMSAMRYAEAAFERTGRIVEVYCDNPRLGPKGTRERASYADVGGGPRWFWHLDRDGIWK